MSAQLPIGALGGQVNPMDWTHTILSIGIGKHGVHLVNPSFVYALPIELRKDGHIQVIVRVL